MFTKTKSIELALRAGHAAHTVLEIVGCDHEYQVREFASLAIGELKGLITSLTDDEIGTIQPPKKP